MSATGDRGGLRSAFAGFKKPADDEAERKLLGRTAEAGTAEAVSYAPATTQLPQRAPEAAAVAAPVHAPPATQVLVETDRLIPRPLRHREAVRQLSFRCPVSIAAELRRKAGFNQLEQQEIIVEGIKRVLAELEAPPTGWDPDA
jgi:hypothetical protein